MEKWKQNLITFKLDERRFRAAVSDFMRRAGPKLADKIVRKAAMDVVGEATNLITTDPARVDTGRYRAGWSMAAKLVNLHGAAATAYTTKAAADNQAKPTDGAIERRGSGLERVIRVINNVEYGTYLEHGTESMAAGRHVSRALETVGNQVAEAAKEYMAETFEGRA